MRRSSSTVRLLIVDDEVAHMMALCDTLEDRGYEAAGFTTGEAGLAALKEKSFDLLLTDLMMPGMDGITLLQEAQKVAPDIVGIIMTGQGTIDTAVAAMQSGAFDYILKPFKLSVILPVLARAMDMRKLRMRNAVLNKRLLRRTKDLARTNKELREASNHKTNFLAKMSHELRTPLNAIIGYAEFLGDEKSGPLNDRQKSQLEMVHSSGKHLLSLINDLLDLSKIESGKAEVSMEWTSPAAVVEEVMRTVEPMAAQKKLTLTRETELPERIYTDRRILFQVLLNLVNNAVKFTETGGVRVEGKANGKTLRMAVADTGIGMRQESVAQLFEAFRQVEGSSRRSQEGTGLGLYLCKRLLELLGGGISAESEPGKGSRFTFTIPLGEPMKGENLPT